MLDVGYSVKGRGNTKVIVGAAAWGVSLLYGCSFFDQYYI